MSQLETIGIILGLSNIALLVRPSLRTYPFGIAMISLFFFVFVEAKLRWELPI